MSYDYEDAFAQGLVDVKLGNTESVADVDIDVIEAAVSYVQLGLHPGGLCEQILLGDLKSAAVKCHPCALLCLPDTYEAVRKIVPAEARDSPEAIASWIERGGLRGK